MALKPPANIDMDIPDANAAATPSSSPEATKSRRKSKSKSVHAKEPAKPKEQYVEVRVAGCALKGRKLCPFAVLLRAGAKNNVWQEVSRTEVVYYDDHPGFVDPFELPNDDTIYRVALYSKTGSSEDIHRCAFLGYAEFTVDRMLRKEDGVIERVLRSRRGKPETKRGHLILCGELVDVPTAAHTYSIQFGFGKESGIWGPMDGLQKKPRKSFYVIYRSIVNGIADEDWVPVYRSEIRDAYAARSVDVSFDGASLSSTRLYANDENRGLRFEVFHFNPSGPHAPLGFVQTSASAFKYARPGGKLFMVSVPGSRLQKGVVYLDMAKTGLTTKRGGTSSVFCLRAKDFVWGDQEDGADNDDYLERDHDGRKRVEWLDGIQPKLPTGVSYMSSRTKLVDSDASDSEAEEEANGKY